MRNLILPEPHLKIGPKGFTFNAACMQLMADVGYVQFFHNFKRGQLYAVECGASDADNTPWRSNCTSSEVRAKRVKWHRFYKHLCDGMGWLHGNVYTIPAVLQEFDEKRLIFFDLSESKEESLFWGMQISNLQTVGAEGI